MIHACPLLIMIQKVELILALWSSLAKYKCQQLNAIQAKYFLAHACKIGAVIGLACHLAWYCVDIGQYENEVRESWPSEIIVIVLSGARDLILPPSIIW